MQHTVIWWTELLHGDEIEISMWIISYITAALP